uniref:Uncharacterized protein n=1 Tax=Plectus sambesii TaxID=2011161 RepID=A0A914VRW6_9BILA
MVVAGMSESHGVLPPSCHQQQRLPSTNELTDLCCDALQQLPPPSYPVGRARLSTVSPDSTPTNSELPHHQLTAAAAVDASAAVPPRSEVLHCVVVVGQYARRPAFFNLLIARCCSLARL